MSNPAHLADAISFIGKLHDGQDVVRMAQALGAALPAERSYWAQATPSTSWCGVFVRWILWRAGIVVGGPRPDGIGPMWVDWWEDVGTEVPVDDRQPGDIAIFLGSPHHVTLVGDQGDYIGGNQSDGVTRGHYREPDRVRRPPAPSAIPGMATGGPALQLSNGKGSWYSQYSGKFEWVDKGDAPGSAALGCPDDAQGVAFYDKGTLGDWFAVTAPNGVTSIEQQTDIGPHPMTGRTIDISAAAAERFGYSPRNFPTDSTFSWRPIAAPAAVASLTPKQQAVRYRDLRKDPAVIDQPTNLPATPSPTTDDGTVKIDLRYILQMITRILDMIDEIKKAKVAPAPVVTPGTTPAKSKPDIVVGILGTIAAALGWGTSTIGAPVGDHATLASIISFAAPIAMTLLGSSGVPIIPAILGLLGRFSPKA